MAKNNQPLEAPDLRLYAGKLLLRGIGDSNGQVILSPRGETLLGRWSRGANGVLTEGYGVTYASRITRALGLESIEWRTHGSARFGGPSYSTAWWVTPKQLRAIEAADKVIRELDPQRKSWDEIADAATAAAVAVINS